MHGGWEVKGEARFLAGLGLGAETGCDGGKGVEFYRSLF